MGIMNWFKNNFTYEGEAVRDKGEYFEVIRIKESLFNFQGEKIKIPKGEAKYLGFLNNKRIE